MCGTFDNLRGTWIAPDGEKKEDRILFSVLSAEIQSSAKNSLDKTFSGPYLFCSWKKDGSRTFKLGQQGKTLAEYATFDESVAALIPGRFMPRGIYYRKHNHLGMMGLIARKQQEQMELFTVFLRCIRHSIYLKYAKEVIQRFDIAFVPYSKNLLPRCSSGASESLALKTVCWFSTAGNFCWSIIKNHGDQKNSKAENV